MLADKSDGVSLWKDYLSHFADVAEIKRWSGREKARYLRASVTGEANAFTVARRSWVCICGDCGNLGETLWA